MKTVELRELGKTGIMVTPVGLGVMQFSGGGGLMGRMFPVISQEDKNGIISAALDGGINWFDTAELYGNGISERSLAAALQYLKVADKDVVIGTKWFPLMRTAKNIGKTIDARLTFLAPYTIDLYMVHQPISFSSIEAQMNAMADLVEAGRIRSVGVSNFNANQLRRAHKALAARGIPLAVNQVQYSLLHRDIESNGVLETAKELGVTIVCWGPLASGLLTGRFHNDPAALEKTGYRKRRLARMIEPSRPVVEALGEIGEKYDAKPAQVALNWLIHAHGETVVAIPGASRIRQAFESAAVMQFKITPDEIAQLSNLAKS